MEDEAKMVADYKIVENGFIVMMVTKVSTPYLQKRVLEVLNKISSSDLLLNVEDKSDKFWAASKGIFFSCPLFK